VHNIVGSGKRSGEMNCWGNELLGRLGQVEFKPGNIKEKANF
jgi:hypothetical protein